MVSHSTLTNPGQTVGPLEIIVDIKIAEVAITFKNLPIYIRTYFFIFQQKLGIAIFLNKTVHDECLGLQLCNSLTY